MIKRSAIRKAIAENQIRPPPGKILVLVDAIEPMRQEGLVWIVDTSFKDQRYRTATVVAVSRTGAFELGWRVRPHDVKPGDRVLIERQAAKPLPGQNHSAVVPGALAAIWENYCLAVIEGDVEEDEEAAAE